MATTLGDTANVKLGACSVTYDGTNLGFTKGGVEVSVETETHEVTVDQLGETVVNEIIMSRNITVTVPLAETTLENLMKVMPGAIETKGSGDDISYVTVTSGTNKSLLDFAKTLVLHPVANEDTDKSDDITIFKAATSGGIDFTYSVDEERVFSVEFKGYPDTDNNNQMFAMGAYVASGS